MYKEIMEQPIASARLIESLKTTQSAAIDTLIDDIENQSKVTFISCGTSHHAALIGSNCLNRIGIDARAIIASEYERNNPGLLIAITQSGETMDVIMAMEKRQQYDQIASIVNVPYSTIQRLTGDGSIDILAGHEVCVASTKAFTAQVTILTLMAIRIAQMKGTISNSRIQQILAELETIPEKVKETLQLDNQVKELARMFTFARNFLYLGRGYNFPVALEGALKLKEISYIHAEGYPAAEMKHGPIALID